MNYNDTHLFGYRAALVLEDDRGEFEVANALTMPRSDGTVALDIERVLDALDARETMRVTRRPIL